MWSELLDSPRTGPAAVALASAAALALALIAQYGFGLEPCRLCLWQRWPYVATLALGLLGAAFAGRPAVRRGALALAALGFLVGAGLAGFHAGVEYGWWPGLPGCAGGGLTGELSMDDVENALAGQDRVVACDEPAIVIAGLSMAGWNFVVSLALAAATAVPLRRR